MNTASSKMAVIVSDHSSKAADGLIPQLRFDGKKVTTLSQLRAELAARTGVPIPQQLLFRLEHMGRYTPIADIATATAENLVYLYPSLSSELQLSFYRKIDQARMIGLSVQVLAEGMIRRCFEVEISSAGTISQLMQMIDEEAGIPPAKQIMVAEITPELSFKFNGAACKDKIIDELIPDLIEKPPVIKLERKKLTTRCKPVPLEVERPSLGNDVHVFMELEADTLHSLKWSLIELNPEWAGRELGNFRLAKEDGVELNFAGSQTLKECGIRSGQKLVFTKKTYIV